MRYKVDLGAANYYLAGVGTLANHISNPNDWIQYTDAKTPGAAVVKALNKIGDPDHRPRWAYSRRYCNERGVNPWSDLLLPHLSEIVTEMPRDGKKASKELEPVQLSLSF